MAYRFIQQYGHQFGVRWLLAKFNILPYEYGKPHKVFENKLNQDFKANPMNKNGVLILHICF